MCRLTIGLLGGLLALSISACGSSGKAPVDSQRLDPDSSIVERPFESTKIIAHAIMRLDAAQSWDRMLYVYPYTFVGQVTTSEKPRHEPPATEKPTPLPPDHPKAGSPPRPPADSPPDSTWYTVRILQVVRGTGYRPGDTFVIEQAGGLHNNAAYQIANDPILRRGQTYLFFVKKASEKADYFFGSPFGRFEVAANQQISVADPKFKDISIVKALNGKSLDQAIQVIQSAR